VLEPTTDLLPSPDPEVELLIGSATDIGLPDSSFDMILAIQVLEHVFDPISATEEMYRCLKPGGLMIILVPQSGTLHLVPHHYQNLTRFWIFEQARRMGAEIVHWKAIGGAWRTIASRTFLMFWPVFNLHQSRDPALGRRPWQFWIAFPFQLLVSLILFPISLLLSLGDISEEANNHLVVIRKPMD